MNFRRFSSEYIFFYVMSHLMAYFSNIMCVFPKRTLVFQWQTPVKPVTTSFSGYMATQKSCHRQLFLHTLAFYPVLMVADGFMLLASQPLHTSCQGTIICVNQNCVAFPDFICEDELCSQCLHILLQITL